MIKNKMALQVTDTGVYMMGLAGVGGVGQIIHDSTGQPAAFWISAILGAVFLRRFIQGPDFTSANFVSVGTGVFLAWLTTDIILNYFTLDPATYKPFVAAFVAGGLEHVGGRVLRVALSPETLKAIINRLVGVGK